LKEASKPKHGSIFISYNEDKLFYKSVSAKNNKMKKLLNNDLHDAVMQISSRFLEKLEI
jgi:hypothetical protein